MAATESKGAIYKHLHTIQVKDLIADSKQDGVIQLRTTDSVETAVGKLSAASITSAPCIDESGECVGFVDYLDILKHIVAAAPSKWDLQRDELAALQTAGRAIALVPLKQIIDLSGRDPYVRVYEEDPATRVVDLFASGVHRVVLFDKNQGMKAICSQSDVVRYLSTHVHMAEMKYTANRSLAELGYTNSAVVEKIDRSATVMQALKTMVTKGVGALAVVDTATGRLEGNFSASDLSGLYFEAFPHLFDSVEDFLRQRSAKSLAPVVGLPTTPLLDMTKALAEQELHHMWVVDDFVPVGIISLTDIMRVAAN